MEKGLVKISNIFDRNLLLSTLNLEIKAIFRSKSAPSTCKRIFKNSLRKFWFDGKQKIFDSISETKAETFMAWKEDQSKTVTVETFPQISPAFITEYIKNNFDFCGPKIENAFDTFQPLFRH